MWITAVISIIIAMRNFHFAWFFGKAVAWFAVSMLTALFLKFMSLLKPSERKLELVRRVLYAVVFFFTRDEQIRKIIDVTIDSTASMNVIRRTFDIIRKTINSSSWHSLWSAKFSLLTCSSSLSSVGSCSWRQW